MALIKHFDTFINEAKGNPKKYKQFWDKGPETQIRRRFGKDYEKSINNRVNLLLTIVDDPDKAEEYAEMDFLSLPGGISTQLVNMDPKEIDVILDGPGTMNQMRGESVDEKLSSSDIKKATKAIKDYVKKLGRRANGEVAYVAAEIADRIGWNEKKRSDLESYLYTINNDSDEIIFGESLTENMLNEMTAKDALRNASDALTKSMGGRDLDKRYVKDYLQSLERMARKVPGLFVKQYGEFTINDYIEDVNYNMANESLNEARFVKEFDKEVLGAETEKDILKIYPNAEFFVGKHSHFFGELEPNLFFKAYYDDSVSKKVKDFLIVSIYSKKGSSYVDLYSSYEFVNESLNEAKPTTEKTIDDLSFLVAKTVKELKDNFEEYQKAKTDKDKKKWTKRAGELTKLKQKSMNDLHAAIQDFHKDVEYDEAYESVLNEGKFDSAEKVAKFLQAKESHFASFLKGKKYRIGGKGPIVTIIPKSNSFTITVDFKKETISTTGKPEHPESVSYVEILDWIETVTKFQKNYIESVDESYMQINEGKDLGEWVKGGKDADKNVLITQFTGPALLDKQFYRDRKCIQVNVGRDYITLNMNDVDELTQILNRYL